MARGDNGSMDAAAEGAAAEVHYQVLDKPNTSSRGRPIKKSVRIEESDAKSGGAVVAEEPKPTPRGRWDGAISPRTPGLVPPSDSLTPPNLPKVPGGGGIFKSAAVAVLRQEKRLMSTGEIARMALIRGYVRCQGKTPEATMASALYTDIKKKGDRSIFTRPEEGLFGLKEWAASAVAEEPTEPLASPEAATAIKRPLPNSDSKPPSPKPVAPSHSFDENLLLLLNAADELENESKPTGFPPESKRRRSENGDYRPCSRFPSSRKVPISRPRPLELPLRFSQLENPLFVTCPAKLPTPAPITPATEEATAPSPAASPSRDSQGSCRDMNSPELRDEQGADGASALPRSDKSFNDMDTSACTTSSDDYSMDGLHRYGNATVPSPAAVQSMSQLPQVGQMLASNHFAARWLKANALISQLHSMFGPKHPLVGKAFLAKARICQLEGTHLSLMEAEQAVMQARHILSSTSDAQAEIMYLLNSIRQQACMLAKGGNLSALAAQTAA